MEWLSVSARAPAREAVERAAGVLRAGGLVVYPTDTLYGLAADPRHAEAVARVFAVKGRPAGQPLPLIACDIRQAGERVAILSDATRRLAIAFWPGPLTLVAVARPGVAPGVEGDEGTVALRVPDHAVARGLAASLGFAVVSTSANPSGGGAPQTARDAVAGLEGRVDLVLDSGSAPGGLPSTIVDARSEPPRLLRHGALPFETILQFLARR